MIEIKNLCKSYKEKVVHENLSLQIPKQEISCIMGPSGCGKTTLLRILAGLESYESGQISGLEGLKRAYVFQEDRLLPWLTVRENIEYVLASWQSPSQYSHKVDELLKSLDLEKEQHQLATTLSGGMKRRVALGRALSYEANLVLMDEPFKGLDYALKMKLLENVVEAYKKQKFTLICVTHDIDEAERLGKIIQLK